MELEDNGKRPLSWNGGDSNVKPNDTGLLLHYGDYQSHVDLKYEHSLLKATLLTPGVANSLFHHEYERDFCSTTLYYTIRRFIEMKVTESACSQERDVPVRIAPSPPNQRMR